METALIQIGKQLEEINKTLIKIQESLEGTLDVSVSEYSGDPLSVFVDSGLGDALRVEITNTVDVSNSDA